MAIPPERLLALVGVLALAGCATPYQPEREGLGYRDREIGPGRYDVSFTGNGWTSRRSREGAPLRSGRSR